MMKVKITPALASEMLEGNTNNRPLNKRHVSVLAEEMRAGRWKFNGDTICMSGQRLLDRQHRLQACILSGKPFDAIVVNGLKQDVFDTIDVGKKRGAADVLAINGEVNTRSLAAALIFVDGYLTGRVSGKHCTYTNTKVEELLEQHPGVRESVLFVKRLQVSKIVSEAVFIGCHYLFSKRDPELADLFCESVIKGQDLKGTDPAYQLRERLLRNSINNTKLPRTHIAALVIKAWNLTVEGKKIRVLRWVEGGPTPEPFPVIL